MFEPCEPTAPNRSNGTPRPPESEQHTRHSRSQERRIGNDPSLTIDPPAQSVRRQTMDTLARLIVHPKSHLTLRHNGPQDTLRDIAEQAQYERPTPNRLPLGI